MNHDLRKLMQLYFKANKTEEEAKALEELLKDNPGLEAEILFFRDLDHALGHHQVEKNRELFRQTVADAQVADRVRVIALRKRVFAISAVAASILLVCIFSFWPSGNESEALFDQFYNPDKSYIVHQGPSPGDHRFPQAIDLFKKDKYDEALPIMQAFWNDDPASDSSNYFMGQILLALGETSEAIPYFERATAASSDGTFSSAGNWYLALAHLKLGHRAQAVPILNGLKTIDDRYGKNAAKLLDEIRDRATD